MGHDGRHPGPVRVVRGDSPLRLADSIVPGGDPVSHRRVAVRRPSTAPLIRSIEAHQGWVMSVALSPCGEFALSGSNDSTLNVWEIATGRQVRSFPAMNPGSARWPSARMADLRSPPRATGSDCGRWTPDGCCARSRDINSMAIKAVSSPWLSAPTGNSRYPARMTTR